MITLTLPSHIKDYVRVSPRIPEPKEPPRPHVVSIRFSDAEKEKLERACTLYARHWKRKRAGQAEILRAGVEMLLEALEEATKKERA